MLVEQLVDHSLERPLLLLGQPVLTCARILGAVNDTPEDLGLLRRELEADGAQNSTEP